ncbi:hypothetical protein C8R45DRAFT_836831 [Mycena sanguinolenta]|nr:hypothetical protein C8R45DRAFT_836831 [Mycena sanguinolenta]
MYIGWLGRYARTLARPFSPYDDRSLPIPIIDRRRRVFALLGGQPHDAPEWEKVSKGAATLLQERLSRVRLTDELLHHRRAQESFAALARGWSHGGGQTEPGELQNNIANTQLTDELLAHKYFQRIANFANMLLAIWAPLLYAFYAAQMALLSGWKRGMRRNFAGSIFAACTFNLGPRMVCAPHLDFGNLAWGWCAITALGDFDLDVGGHLILWDLRLVIRFPPGSTILLPSALIRHSNVPIRSHERRFSFVQYTAGGLFRWVRNGFKTDEDWQRGATRQQKADRAAEDRARWEEGLKMFSVIDKLGTRSV